MIEAVDSTAMGMYYKIFTKLRKGDSLSMRKLTDTIMKAMPGTPPEWMKKGHYMYTTLKVIDVFTTQEAAQAAAQKAREEQQVRMEEAAKVQLVTDEKAINDFLKSNNIQAQRAAGGTYVEIIQPGTGPNIDTTVMAVVNYTGKDLKTGKVFDSNVDPQFNHVQPFPVNMTTDPTLGGRVIPGWTDGLKMLNKGAKARLYIPSTLAYGAQGNRDILPNTNLVFDVEITDVLNKDNGRKFFDAQMEIMRKRKEAMLDSISKQSSVAPDQK